MTTLTNAEGNYEMRKLKAGKYVVTFEKTGYKKLEITVVIADGKVTDADGEMEKE